MAQYIINISDGAGSMALPPGTYNIYGDVPFYNGSLSSSTLIVTDQTSTKNLTISATGTFIMNVSSTGTSSGTPIVGATFIRCNADGSETYGGARTSDSNGNCIFNNVPFGTDGLPYTIFARQLTSDTSHSIDPEVITFNMESQIADKPVENPPAALQIFYLQDTYYHGLNLSGALILEGPLAV